MEIEKIEGVEGIKFLFEKILTTKPKFLYTALSDKPLVYLAGDNFADNFMNKRKDSGIFLKSLRFTRNNVDKAEHKNYSSYNKEVRLAPKNAVLNESILIWDSNVAFVNVDKVEGIIVHDQEYSTDMKVWFENLWEASK